MNTIGKYSLESIDGNFWNKILEMDQRLFPRPWSRPLWEDLDGNHHQIMSWSKGEALLGFALFSLVPGDDIAHLLKILMQPEHRGRGETVLFWREIAFELEAKGAKSVFLEVEASNLRAIAFYQKIGFKSLRQVKAYYSDGSDALTMSLTL